MSRRLHDPTAARRRRLAAALRLVAGAAWLALAVTVFRLPLAVAAAPAAQAVGLEDLVRPSAPGFLLSVVSLPPGGRLSVNGVDRGTVPLVANVICEEGQKVRLVVVQEGFAPWEHEVDCREGRALRVTARLEEGR